MIVNSRLLLPLIALLAGSLLRVDAGEEKLAVKLEFESYLQFERIMAVVSIYNDTEFPVVITPGTNTATGLRLLVRQNKKDVMKPINALPMITDLNLAPGERNEQLFDIADWYNFSEMGNYEIVAEFFTPNQTWRSAKVLLDIVRGIELVSTERTVPGYADRMRQYSVRYWARNKKEYLFLRVEEKENELIYGIFQLGPVIRVVDPMLEVDRMGNVVVVHQVGKDKFARTVFKSDTYSMRFVDQTYFDSKGQTLSDEEDSKKIKSSVEK